MSYNKHLKTGLNYCDTVEKARAYAQEQTDKEVYQACEAFIHNLNTLQSRAGDQLPFTSVNFGTDTSNEGRMITRCMLEATIKGVGAKGITPIFPISIFQLREGINDKEGTPNYDLKRLAIECASKRIYPNFANTDAPHLTPVTDKTELFCTMGKLI